jgi:plastocyanin
MAVYEARPNPYVLTALVIVGVLIAVSVGAVLVLHATPGIGPATSASSVTSSGPTVILPQGVGSNSALNYEPATITVVIGVNNTVTWIDQDNTAPHTVTSVAGGIPSNVQAFNSGNLNDGDTFKLTFNVTGVYHYYCIYHPWMKGIVIVKAGSGSSSAPSGSSSNSNTSPSSALIAALPASILASNLFSESSIAQSWSLVNPSNFVAALDTVGVLISRIV